jgi:hypothetical protein
MEADRAQRAVRSFLMFARRESEDREDEGEVLEDRHPFDQFEVLEHHSDLAPEVGELRALHGAEVAAVDDDLPIAGPHLPEDEFEQRRLAGAAGTREKDEFALVDVKRHVVQCGRVSVEPFGDVVKVDHRAVSS